MEEDNIKEKVKEQFGKNAEKYVASITHAKAADLTTLVEWLKPAPDWTVLDVATGGGHVSKALSPHVGHVFSTDLTQQMLEAAYNHLSESCSNIWYVVADAEALPFLNDTFDAVVCRIAAHHFPNPAGFVQEASRVLKPGGKFLLIDNISPDDASLDNFVNTMEKLRDESHGRCYSVKEWRQWFENEGLIVRSSETRKKALDFPVWVRRTAQSEEQVEAVVNHILSADEPTLRYFSVEKDAAGIRAIRLDEWMVMAEKV